MRDADRVRDLHLAAIGEPGGDDVLRDVARRVGGRAVDLRRVLAREGAAAVARRAAVGVDDDLAPGEAGVAHRAADDELAGRVHVDEVARPGPALLVVEVGGQDRARARARQVGLDQRLGVAARRACCVETRIRSISTGLRPSRRPRSGPSPAPCRRAAGTAARSALRTSASRRASWCASMIGSGISSGGLVARVAEHHPLVAGAARSTGRRPRVVLRLVRRVDALRDVGRLLVDRHDDAAGRRRRSRTSASVVADVLDPARARAAGCPRRSRS